MKGIITSVFLLLISTALFAQTSGTTQQESKGKSGASPSQIAVSDPGAPSKRNAAPPAKPNSGDKTTGKNKPHFKKVKAKFPHK